MHAHSISLHKKIVGGRRWGGDLIDKVISGQSLRHRIIDGGVTMSTLDLESAERHFGISFADKEAFDTGWWRSPLNRKLEYLGDAVLELAVREYLHTHLSNIPTSGRSQLCAKLVSNDHLRSVSKPFSPDMFEVIIGALFVEQGFAVAQTFITRTVLVRIEEVRKPIWNPLFTLAERVQEFSHATLEYRGLGRSGKGEERVFVAGVFIDKELVAKGQGFTKLDARKDAAQSALVIKGWEK